MDSSRLVLNNLVFVNDVNQGVKQVELLQRARDLGFDNVEVRREFFKNLTEEMPEIKQKASELGLGLYYSVPEEVYVNGKVNPALRGYLDEAQKMGVKEIKWNIGDFTGELYPEELQELIDTGIIITVENDQTQTSGTIGAIEKFMQAVTEAGLNIGYVYDMGNWRYVGEDEEKAAERLKDYVVYIHVKDGNSFEGKPVTVPLSFGEINWKKILNILPDAPIAIEYPTESNNEIKHAKKLLLEVD